MYLEDIKNYKSIRNKRLQYLKWAEDMTLHRRRYLNGATQLKDLNLIRHKETS